MLSKILNDSLSAECIYNNILVLRTNGCFFVIDKSIKVKILNDLFLWFNSHCLLLKPHNMSIMRAAREPKFKLLSYIAV